MKAKTSSSIKKRFKLTGSGKLRSAKASHNHLLTQKSRKQKRLSKIGMETFPGEFRHLKGALPGMIHRRKNPSVKKESQAAA